MAELTVKENILTTDSRLPNAPCLAYDYNLVYDPDTGESYVVRQVGTGGNITKPSKNSQCDYIFTNGAFTQAAIDTFGEKRLNELFLDVKTNLNKTYQVVGGSTKGAIKPSFLGNQTFDVVGTPTTSTNRQSQTNLPSASTLGTTAGISGSSSSTSNNGSSTVSSLFGGLSTIPGLSTSANEKNKYGSGSEKLLIYPTDLITTQQDTLHITEYNYKSPSGSELLGGNVGKILSGLTKTSATKEFLGTVILPIPNNVADNNSVAWGADTMNNLTAAMTAQVMGNPALSTGGAVAGQVFKSLTGFDPTPLAAYAALGLKADKNDPAIKAQIEAAIGSLVLKAAQFDVPPETILARGLGVVPNSNLELLFQGPTLREFSFGWRLSPRSENEAKTVRKIIRVFKQGMAARKLNSGASAGTSAALLGTPNVFKLEYKMGNSSIPGLNKFKLCALTNCSVSYAPDGQWAAYEDGQPVSVTLGLSFTEIEPIFEGDYQENITGELSGKADLSPITADDIGY
jgi:hypothetical protein